MTETKSCVEKSALLDYLYGEADAEARARVEAHLRVCAACADEVRELTEVRGTLGAWVPPEIELGFRVVTDAEAAPARVSGWSLLRRPPAWGLAAAAVLVLVTVAAIARPEIQFGRDGMVVSVGWRDFGGDAAAQPDAATRALAVQPRSEDEPMQNTPTVRGTPVASGTGANEGLAGPGSIVPPMASGGAADADAWLQRVRQLIRESEQRQARALAEQIQQVEQQNANRRRADLVEMQRAFGEVDVSGEELVRREELFEFLRQISTR